MDFQSALEKTQQELAELELELQRPENIGQPRKMKEINKRFYELKKINDLLQKRQSVAKNIKENQLILEANEPDDDLYVLASEENAGLNALISELEARISEYFSPRNPLDRKNAIVEIRAGAGGDESSLFAGELFRMYARYAESRHWSVHIISANRIGIGGFKEIIFEVLGDQVYGTLKYESGTHRVQRVPETEKQGRVHTSTATVAVLPEAEEVDLEIRPEDLRLDTFCASGHGGQSVNTTYSAVRVTHLPSGMSVSCQDERSQQQNKEKAISVLKSRLLAEMERKRQEELSRQRKSQIGSGDRAEKIRTYNFPQDRITDHRVKKNWHNIRVVLDGGIEPLIDALSQADRQQPDY